MPNELPNSSNAQVIARLLPWLTASERAELRRLEQASTTEAEGPLVRFGAEWLKDSAPSGWVWDWPYQLRIYAALDRVTRGECRRLMLSVPPRHAKTETVTVRYAAWRLERDPRQRVVLAAYNQDQANLYARKVRRIVAPRVPLATDSKRVDDWELAGGGGLRSVGVGAGVTGRGADLIIIDDPVKSREEADSEAYRDRVWEWYTDDLWTRQEPGAAIILIQTRWHEDDLAGRLQRAAEQGGEAWEVLNFSALAEENDPLGRAIGEALCPARFTAEDLKRAQAVLQRNFWALYQGRPLPAGGAIFKKAWFRRWEAEGEYFLLHRGERTQRVRQSDCWIFATVDLSASEKTTADWSVIATWAVTPTRDLLLLDVLREREEGPEVKAHLRSAHRRWRPVFMAVERNGLGLPIVQDLLREGLPIRPVLVHRDKVSRALGAAARYEAGAVFHPEQAPWAGEWERELLSFPSGAHDDQVDTAGTATAALAFGGVVFLEFSPALHVAAETLPLDETRPLVCGWAFSPLPAWVCVQLNGSGQLCVLASRSARDGEGAWEFGSRVRDLLARDLEAGEREIRHYAHPDCRERTPGKAEARSLAEVLARGSRIVTGHDERGRPVYAERPPLGIHLARGEESRSAREEAIRARLNLLLPGGVPALVVDPGATLVTEALAGGYARGQHDVTGQFLEDPEPNVYRAVVDALGQAVCRLFSAAPREAADEDVSPLSITTRTPGRRSYL